MMSLLEACRSALSDPNVQAFLRVIREGESSQTNLAYRMLVGGGTFDSFADHPRKPITLTIGSKQIVSTAAGAYQFLSRTWDDCRAALNLPDFSPACQDLGAVFLLRRRGALDAVKAGRLAEAVEKCNLEWASLPGDRYGQGGMSMDKARAVFEHWGGTVFSGAGPAPTVGDGREPDQPPAAGPAPTLPAGEAPGFEPGPPPADDAKWPFPQTNAAPPPQIPAGEAPQWEPGQQPTEHQPMTPIIAAVLPSLIESIPRLAELFGSGSKIAERNVKAAGVVVDLVQRATGSVNAQDAAERVQRDPAARVAAASAIESQWWALTSEAGGGGIAGARAADAQAMPVGKPWLSPSMIALALLVPLAYMVVGSVVGLWGNAKWSTDVQAAIASSVVALIVGGAAGFYWGSTTSRNRPPGAQ